MTRLATSSAAHDDNNVTEITQFELSKALTFSKFFSKEKLSPSARLVLRCLVDCWNPEKGLVYPGQKFISEATGSSPKSVTNAVNELREKMIILTAKKGLKLNYYFTRKFFELVKITDTNSKNYGQLCVNFTDNNKRKEQINNKRFKNLKNETSSSEKSNNSEFPICSERRIKMPYWKTSGEDERKTSKYHSDCHTKGMNYPKYTPEKVENTVSPSSSPAWLELRKKMKGRVE